MILLDTYSFNHGEEFIKQKYPQLLREIVEVIEQIDAETCRKKSPKGNERRKLSRIGEENLYSPPHLNALFDYFFHAKGWELKPMVKTNDRARGGKGTREMDFVKETLGVEVQFGKYAFLTYDIVAKMNIFRNIGIIESGVEICPMACMLPHLSSGIGAFEQVKWDLEYRGAVEDFDVPTLLIGVATEKTLRLFTKTDSIFDKAEAVAIRNRKLKLDATLKKVRETGLDV